MDSADAAVLAGGDEKRVTATVESRGEPPHSKMLRSRVLRSWHNNQRYIEEETASSLKG
jgi:hypothetical protein